MSGNFVIMAVLGGMRSFWGPLIGAAIFVVLQDYVSSQTAELDVLHRTVLRAGGAVLPARRARHHPAQGALVTLLQVENVSQAFRQPDRRQRRLHVTVEPGELRAVIGPNGAGKTTFFNLISGFLPPTSGRILFDGRGHHRPAAGASGVAMGMARTFQITEIFPELSVRENLRIAGRGRGGLSPSALRCLEHGRRQEVAARVAELIEMGGLAARRTGWWASCPMAISAPPRS